MQKHKKITQGFLLNTSIIFVIRSIIFFSLHRSRCLDIIVNRESATRIRLTAFLRTCRNYPVPRSIRADFTSRRKRRLRRNLRLRPKSLRKNFRLKNRRPKKTKKNRFRMRNGISCLKDIACCDERLSSRTVH